MTLNFTLAVVNLGKLSLIQMFLVINKLMDVCMRSEVVQFCLIGISHDLSCDEVDEI